MKKISYKFLAAKINRGTEEEPHVEQIFRDKSMTYSEANEEIAKKEAYNGEYTIEDDGKSEPIIKSSQLDVIEAQITYTAMMTGTLLEV